MPQLQSSLLRDPRTPANLVGLQSLSVKVDTSELSIPGVSVHRIKKRAKELLEEEGLKIDNKSSTRLTISLATEMRDNQRTVVYAVQVELRESVTLARENDSAVIGEAGTWRHQATTGVLFPPFNFDALAKGLSHEALRQVESFASDLAEGNSEEPDVPNDDEDPSTDPTPIDPNVEKIRRKLEELLKRLGVGDDCSASVEKFEVSGTTISFRATITHRKKNPARPLGGKYLYSVDTSVEGNLDITSPATLANAKACTKLPPILGRHEVCIPLKDLASVL